jgi:hypothetical protein
LIRAIIEFRTRGPNVSVPIFIIVQPITLCSSKSSITTITITKKVGFDSESAIEVPSDNDNNPKPGRDDLKFDDDDDYDKNGSHRFVEKMPGVYSEQALQDVKMHPVQDCHVRVMHYSYDHHHRTHHVSYNSVRGTFPDLQPSKHKIRNALKWESSGYPA